MKKLTLITLFMMGFAMSYAQNQPPQINKIEVKGTAEVEVVPDEIYLRITLKEYKSGNKTVTLNEIESGLVKAIQKLGLPKESLTVDNVYGYNWDYRKKRPDEILAAKSFKLKLTDLKMFNDLVEKIDPEGVNNLSIAEVSHSKLEQYKKDLRIQAVKNAKEKAGEILGGIGETLGGAIEIQEIDYGYNPGLYRSESMAYAKTGDNYQSEVEFKKIALKAEVRAVFEIK